MTKRELMFCVGTRPDCIKMAPLIKECRRRGLVTAIVNTGQHFDANMNDDFLDEFGLDSKDVSYLRTTNKKSTPAEIYMNVLNRMGDHCSSYLSRHFQQDPIVLVYGDTWTALACGTAAAREGFPTVHVEAGLRSHDLSMPEECVRIQLDALCSRLFAPTIFAAKNLKDEGNDTRFVHLTGNLVADAVAFALDQPGPKPTPGESMAVLTLHRIENVETKAALTRCFSWVAQLKKDKGWDKVLFPVHPRTTRRLEEFGLCDGHVTYMSPVGYADMIKLLASAQAIITDSGGIQEEACILGVPCYTLRRNTERPETLALGSNVLVDTWSGWQHCDWRKMVKGEHKEKWEHPYGRKVAKKMASTLEEMVR